MFAMQNYQFYAILQKKTTVSHFLPINYINSNIPIPPTRPNNPIRPIRSECGSPSENPIMSRGAAMIVNNPTRNAGSVSVGSRQ